MGQRKMKMDGPCRWIPLTLLLVLFLASGSEGRYKDQCCVDHWVKYVGPVLDGLAKAMISGKQDFDNPKFNQTFWDWQNMLKEMKKGKDAEPEGICDGMLNLRCIRDSKSTEKEGVGRCECNKVKPLDFGVDSFGNTCVAKGVGSICFNGADKAPCKEGMVCEEMGIAKAKPFGKCVMMKKSGGPQVQLPITAMWILIICLLAFIPHSVVGMEGSVGLSGWTV